MKTIVIGAGNWGTTLASVFARNGPVSLWTNSRERADAINSMQENRQYLPGVRLPKTLRAVEKFSEPIGHDDVVLLVVPSKHVRSLAGELADRVNGNPIVCASKGFEHDTFKTLSEVIRDEIPTASVIVLTGPNLAKEVAAGKPTKAVLASKDLAVATQVAKTLKNDVLGFEICCDVKGVELCAALKGIVAIGVGMADGLELGDNFIGLIMTYGLKEFAAIAETLGIDHKTIYGVAGLGDLVATCLSPNSRNRRFGRAMARGLDRDGALKEVGMVVEGVQMCSTIAGLEELNINMPLFSRVASIIFQPNGDWRKSFVDTLIKYR